MILNFMSDTLSTVVKIMCALVYVATYLTSIFIASKNIEKKSDEGGKKTYENK